MSWWDIGDDVIGDAPADIMRHALGEIARAKQTQAKPTLQELLNGFAAALRKIEAGQRDSFQKVVARQESGPAVAATGESADDQLVSTFEQAFKDIEKEYQQRFERKPRLSELLQTLLFVIGHEPERFLFDAEGLKVNEIVAE